MVDNGGRVGGGGRRRDGSEVTLMGGGGILRSKDSNEGWESDNGGSLSCGWPEEVLIDEAKLLAEETLLIATEDELARYSPRLNFDSIKRSPT